MDVIGEQLDPRVLEPVARYERVQVAGGFESEREPEHLAVAEPKADALTGIALADTQLLLQHLAKRPLDDLVLQRCNAERASSAIRLRDEPPPRRLRPVRSPVNTAMQVDELVADGFRGADLHVVRAGAIGPPLEMTAFRLGPLTNSIAM